MNWFLNTGHKLVGIIIFLTQLVVHFEDIADRFSGWLKIKSFYERRKGMFNPLKYVNLIPVFEKTLADLKTAESNPQNQALVADLEAFLADIKEDTAQ